MIERTPVPASETNYPSWACMGMWIQHKVFKIMAQVIDAEDGWAVIEIWEGHSVVPDLDLLEATEGGFKLNSTRIKNDWEQSSEPVVYPSIWDHIFE
jgi:hypothetical protein